MLLSHKSQTLRSLMISFLRRVRNMLPVDTLINEHTLIIRFVRLIRKEAEQIAQTRIVKPNAINQVIGFLRVYAERYHLGKEEGILFRELSQKKLSEEDQITMHELVMEHALGRKTLRSLENAQEVFIAGKTEALEDILQLLSTLVELYLKHIEKENKQFFYQSMKYFTQEEQDDMVKRSELFDQNFINKYFEQVVDVFEKL
jgi:hemerythrin-like domain-containing protein